MKTTIGLLILSLTVWLVSCQTNTPQPSASRYEAGISQDLARLRKQQIQSLRYDLRFSIPEQKTLPVQGEARIRFTLETPEEVILDFRETDDKLHSVAVNGVETPYVFRNEHLILPPAAMQQGENEVHIRFVAGNQSLNRNEAFLYTLLVPDRARTLFPCFEQPNLKASFTLQLDIPQAWQAVSNTYITREETTDSGKTVCFAPTEPLSTYLFSFVAGDLQRQTYTHGERTIAAYYRETDPKKLAQLETIFKQVIASLEWLEAYTAIPYPFAKYDFIILPGFQYGGMEHTGATLYNDTQLFLSEHPTPDEELRRTQLIAHETAHMWFGDLVTMDWFDDVWTKEVFANYFAACITEPLFPDINHRLNRMKTYTAAALSEDRTPGSTAIRQPLDNLQYAGLIYSQIVYNKAPVMMAKLVEQMGEEAFRTGIQKYLKTYAYANATWDDLIQILDNETDCDLAAFSDVWVNRQGMPVFHTELTADNELSVQITDPYGRGLHWPQQLTLAVGGERDTTWVLDASTDRHHIHLPYAAAYVLPNVDGETYGQVIPDRRSREWLLAHWSEIADDTSRQALLMQLYENFLLHQIAATEWSQLLVDGVRREQNPLIASTLIGYLPTALRELPQAQQAHAESELYALSQTHPLPSCRVQLLRMLSTTAHSPALVRQLYQLWDTQRLRTLSERDYTTLAYELAVRLPEQGPAILAKQRQRIQHPDRLRQFDFIAPATTADTLQLDSVFRSLLQAENRRIEPWAATALSYLNHPARGTYAVKYIRPGLEVLTEVQRTGDIFFPKNWVSALLRNHQSEAAYQEVEAFLAAHPDYLPLLKSKILQASYSLYRNHSKSPSKGV